MSDNKKTIKDQVPDQDDFWSIDEPETTEATIDEDRLVSDYMKRTDRKRAIESLRCNIETIQQGMREIWSTGIPSLDEKLDGGFHPKQLVFIGAISSLGKTSLALQIADNVARSGRDVLIFSLEMDSDELLAKSISRETYLLTRDDKIMKDYRLTTRDILSGRIGSVGDQKRELFEKALAETRQLDDHLFYYIGENDVDIDAIRALVELHRKARKQNPLVILDYLQILRPSEDALSRRLDKRLITDDDVTKLKVMARDCEIPVIAISAFNRDSYLQEVSMSSFKESSGVEYSSDVLLGMQYTNMDYKKHWYREKGESGKSRMVYESKQNHELRVRNLFSEMDRSDVRPLELKILKNRNGKRGSVFFNFVAKYNFFEESGTDEHKPEEWVASLKGDDDLGGVYRLTDEVDDGDPILDEV